MQPAFKLLRLRKDGTLGSLFIDRARVRPVGIWLTAFTYETPGYQLRPGWHCMGKKDAPHLAMTGRIWCDVEIEDFEIVPRPVSQGGAWYLAKRMKIIGPEQGRLEL